MHRIDGANPGPGNTFVEGDVQAGTPRTQITDDWLNAVQEELAATIEGAGLALSKPSNAQLLAAVGLLARANGGRRNWLHNGAMVVSQRHGISGGPTLGGAASGFSADRWRYYTGTGGAAVVSKFGAAWPAADQLAMGGAMHGIGISQGTGGTGPYLEQRIESVLSLQGQLCTLSLWANLVSVGSGSSLQVTTEIVQHFGSGGSADVVTAGPTFTIQLAPTNAVRFSGQVTIPSIAGKVFATSEHHVAVRFKFPNATTFSLDLTGAQLEIGAAPTPFEFVPLEVELARLQRFYQATGDWLGNTVVPGVASDIGSVKVVGSGTTGRPLDRLFTHPMRKAPTVTWYAPSNGAAASVDWEGAVRAVTGQTGESSRGPGYPTVAASRAMSALEAHYKADSEL